MTRRTVQLVGSLVAIIAIGWALARGIGADTFRQRADDLAYYASQHMLLVVYSMTLAILALALAIRHERPSRMTCSR